MLAKLLAVIVLVLPAWLSMPLETRIHKERKQLKYGGAHVNLSLRDSMGQGMAIGLLAGFRGVVADFLWIQSHSFWEKKEWLRQYRNMEVVTTLQPQSVLFWDLSQWHMAWNIAYAVSVDPANRTKAEGIKRQREWQLRARDFLQRGLENVPHRYELYFTMGWLYWQKLSKFQEDAFCRAAEYFGLAAGFSNAPAYVQRMYARALEKCGRIEDALEMWKIMWTRRHEPHQLPVVIEREIRRLENELALPAEQRVFPPAEVSTNPMDAPTTL